MISLNEMFADAGVRAQVGAMLNAPRGIFAFNGGDGSGKSTSLFALAHELVARGKPPTVIVLDADILFIPSAYPKQVTERMDIRIVADRSLLPAEIASAAAKGIVVVDEIEQRIARAVVDAAKAGATIFTTIHTPYIGIDCAYALQKMAISTAEFLEVFSCIATQMLIPRLCDECGAQVTLDATEAQLVDPTATKETIVWNPVGCAKCNGKGTDGYVALHEVLVINDETRPVLASYLDKGDLKSPLPEGHVTMQELARRQVRKGTVGFETFKREITQNPILRMQHQWELERRHGADAKERLSRLRRFFSPAVAEMILSGAVEDPLKSRRREIVVVFLDLREFTAFAETNDPEDVMRVLGDYHAAMGELVMQQGATLERFAGDGMMIFLNDPMPVDHPARDAVAMAVTMQRRFEDVRKGWRKLGIDLGLGIGIAQGFATIGAIGYEGRRDYGAIGVVANLASRLCSEAATGQILVSQRVFGNIEGDFRIEAVGLLALKGFHAPVPAYSVLWDA